MYKKVLCTCKVVVLPSKLINFWWFSLLPPSSLLKLPIVVIQKFCYHDNMTSHFFSLYEKGMPISLKHCNCFCDCYWVRAGFFPEVFATVIWAQFPFRDECLFSPLTELNREEKLSRHVAMVAKTPYCCDPQILLPW